MPLVLYPMISADRRDFATCLPSTSLVDPGQRPKPPVQRAQGIPATDKHCPLRALRNSGLMCLARRDAAVGTHAYLTVFTQVWNPSHHHLI
jgi:hypothetical protein